MICLLGGICNNPLFIVGYNMINGYMEEKKFGQLGRCNFLDKFVAMCYSVHGYM